MSSLRGIIAVIASLVLSYSCCAQIRMLPRATVDSLVASSQARSEGWAEDFLQFDMLVFNAGTVRENDAPVSAVFRFKNIGEDPLRLLAPRTSCTCVSAEISASLLRPGQSSEVTAVYNQHGHPGRHPRQIYLYADGPSDNPVAVLILDVLVED